MYKNFKLESVFRTLLSNATEVHPREEVQLAHIHHLIDGHHRQAGNAPAERLQRCLD